MTKSNKIYMDYAASISPNPSSIHEFGINAKKKLETARLEVGSVLGCRKEEIIFTSGGTESNNLAIQGVVWAWHENLGEKILPHIITTNIEHPSVLETCKLLAERKLAQISIVPVEASGIVDPKKIKKEIKKNTVLISVMYANNEIGTIQPIKEIAKEIRHYRKTGRGEVLEHGYFSTEKFLVLAPSRSQVSKTSPLPLFHSDAVQATNYLDLNVEKLGVDMLTLSGAKVEDAGRIGVLYKKASVPLANVFGGGDQEGGLRPGTENLSEILKFSVALKSAQNIKEKEMKRLIKLRDYFFDKIFKNTKNSAIAESLVILNGDKEKRLPNNVNITIPKIPSDLLVIELSARGIMVSSKSACKSSRAEGSYVIEALRPKSNPEIGGLRFSLGRNTNKKEIDYTVKSLSEILTKLKKWY